MRQPPRVLQQPLALLLQIRVQPPRVRQRHAQLAHDGGAPALQILLVHRLRGEGGILGIRGQGAVQLAQAAPQLAHLLEECRVQRGRTCGTEPACTSSRPRRWGRSGAPAPGCRQRARPGCSAPRSVGVARKEVRVARKRPISCSGFTPASSLRMILRIDLLAEDDRGVALLHHEPAHGQRLGQGEIAHRGAQPLAVEVAGRGGDLALFADEPEEGAQTCLVLERIVDFSGDALRGGLHGQQVALGLAQLVQHLDDGEAERARAEVQRGVIHDGGGPDGPRLASEPALVSQEVGQLGEIHGRHEIVLSGSGFSIRNHRNM